MLKLCGVVIVASYIDLRSKTAHFPSILDYLNLFVWIFNELNASTITPDTMATRKNVCIPLHARLHCCFAAPVDALTDDEQHSCQD